MILILYQGIDPALKICKIVARFTLISINTLKANLRRLSATIPVQSPVHTSQTVKSKALW